MPLKGVLAMQSDDLSMQFVLEEGPPHTDPSFLLCSSNVTQISVFR